MTTDPTVDSPTSRSNLARFDGVDVLAAMVGEKLESRWDADAGLLESICQYALVPTGKLFRPILLIESALAVGGDAKVVLPAAMGAESGHVASLVHDDIIDRDELRRGRPSVYHKHGIDNAIVAGDALIFDLFAGLAECRRSGAPDDRIVAALEVVANCGIDLCRGQSLEAELCQRLEFDAGSYIAMAKLKTAALFRGACECGAILAGADVEKVLALGSYAENMGAAFQVHDDILPFTQQSETLGKSHTSDIKNGRLTLPVILAYEAGETRDRQAIRALLGGSEYAEYRRDLLIKILERTGAITAASTMARQFVEQSVDSLRVLPATDSRDRLRRYAEASIDRDR